MKAAAEAWGSQSDIFRKGKAWKLSFTPHFLQQVRERKFESVHSVHLANQLTVFLFRNLGADG